MSAIEYLAGLNPEAAKVFPGYYDGVVPFEFKTPADCIQCLSCFVENGVSLRYVFENAEVWGMFLESISEERYHKAIQMLLELGSPQELMDYLCWMYKCGISVIPDAEYDAIEMFYTSEYPQLAYLKTTTPDDVGTRNTRQSPLVMEAVKMSSVRSSKISPMKLNHDDSSYALLNSEKSTSIYPVRTCTEVYEFLKKAPTCVTHWSLKIDGVNTKCLIKDGKLDVALSRGRATDSWDYTEAVRRVMSMQGVDVSGFDGRITGETLVDSDGLEIIRAKYPDKDYKSPKSAAGAMLRAPQKFDVDDYKWLRFMPFDAEELMKDKAFEKLRSAGFTTPPELMFEMTDIPLGNEEEFERWLTANVLDPMWESAGGKQNMTDGVVLQLLTNVESERVDKYSDLNIALKFSHWAEQEYTSVVTGICLEQQRVVMSVVLEIEPTVTRDLNTATRVNVGSSQILVRDNVRVGDTIRFTRKSEAINIYVGKV